LFQTVHAAGVASVGGMAVGAVPLVTATLAAAHAAGVRLDGFFVRREAKGHGTARRIDGRFDASARIALVEDVVTTGESTLQAIEAVEAEGGKVSLVVAVVDRMEDDGLARLARRAGRAEALVNRLDVERAAEGPA
jgi:orotate phosphoribosyltransferase